MRCTDVVKRLNEERDWDVNKSQLLYYDDQGIVSPRRDKFFRRNYTEKNYTDVKWAISLSRAGVSIPAIKQILSLDLYIMELTAKALKAKSKSDWLTAEEIKDRMTPQTT